MEKFITGNLYDRDEFYIEDFHKLPDKFKKLWLDLWGIDSVDQDFDPYEWAMDAINTGRVKHIYELINMFFMFVEQYDVIQTRYLLKNKNGDIIEKPYMMVDRVANFIASAEPRDFRYGVEKMNKWYLIFLKKLMNFELSPNSPAWSSAGIPGFGGFACLVAYNDDSLEGIGKWYRDVLFMNRYGFGIGHSLHKIRPKNSPYAMSKNKTNSSLKWLDVIDSLSVNMAQGMTGREGANMVTIPVWHPDVEEFINYKNYAGGIKIGVNDLLKSVVTAYGIPPEYKDAIVSIIESAIPLKRFNMSVVITDEFMEAVINDKSFELKFELPDHNYKFSKKIKARELFDRIVENAWLRGDPGVLFFDRINKDNYLRGYKGDFFATNPCFTYDELVVTNEGFKKIGDIVKNKLDVKPLTAMDGKLLNIEKYYDNGIKNVYKVITYDGYTVNATGEQELYVWDKVTRKYSFVKVEDLEDYRHCLVINDHGLEFDIDSKRFFKGFIVGYGFENAVDSHLTFVFKQNEIDYKVRNYFYSNLKKHGIEYDVNDSKYMSAIVILDDEINDLYKSGDSEKIILNDVDFVAGFISGYFNANAKFPNKRTSSSRFSIDVYESKFDLDLLQRALAMFGIKSTLKTVGVINGVKLKRMLYVSSSHMANLINNFPLINERKRDRLIELLGKKSLRANFHSEVIGVVSDGMKDVYDIYIPGDPTMVVNGVKAKDCGEIPLHEYGVCNLWTINLMKHYDFNKKSIVWDKFADTVRVAVRMGDDLTSVNNYPKEIPEIEKSAKDERRIGIDITGLADMLFVSGIRYGSNESLAMIKKIYKFIRDNAREYSVKLGRKKGSFPLLKYSSVYWDNNFSVPDKCPDCGGNIEVKDGFVQCESCNWGKFKSLRNMYLLTQAPTGSRSRKMAVSFGIEPYYDLFYMSRVLGKEFMTAQRIPEFYVRLKAKHEGKNLYSYTKNDIENFVTTYDLAADDHLNIQIAAQVYVDQSVSKTVNLPNSSTIDDVKDIYIKAWKGGCKGITIYRQGSHYREVIGEAMTCPNCGSSNLIFIEGCYSCRECGTSGCSV